MEALIVVLSVLAGLGCWVGAARVLYARWRPSSLPVNCTGRSRFHTHYERCYRRNETLMIDGNGEAAAFALLAALLWPVILPVLGLAFLVRVRQPETREELQAKIAELEREAGIT